MAADVKALVERMQGFYEKTQDFTARFQQDYTYQAFKRKQTSTGTVAFKKPGLMRWEYLKPSTRTFVLSNDKVYAYDPAAMTLTKGTFDSSQLSASVTFLWGKGQLADEFQIAKVACKDCQGTLLELTPKEADPRFKLIRLEVDPKTAQVRRSIVIDPDGSQNAITFLDMKTNTGLTDAAFKLAPPANTQVIDMTRK
ncbi:MAG: outer membrane lipoprotein carrier protein LolA [Myxococcota bacterium]|nr:outer membrane lipoprotein carrier protein LolA [Myxococcota bacterium]